MSYIRRAGILRGNARFQAGNSSFRGEKLEFLSMETGVSYYGNSSSHGGKRRQLTFL